MTLTPRQTFRAFSDRNWMHRDVQIKRWLGFDDAYFHRAARILNVAGSLGVR
jgi:hypothetical protein